MIRKFRVRVRRLGPTRVPLPLPSRLAVSKIAELARPRRHSKAFGTTSNLMSGTPSSVPCLRCDDVARKECLQWLPVQQPSNQRGPHAPVQVQKRCCARHSSRRFAGQDAGRGGRRHRRVCKDRWRTSEGDGVVGEFGDNNPAGTSSRERGEDQQGQRGDTHLAETVGRGARDKRYQPRLQPARRPDLPQVRRGNDGSLDYLLTWARVAAIIYVASLRFTGSRPA